ncbi:MAG: protein kinase [Deltaproteobacteria bacterium]|nr:MAG: protein kinase [Deltaproteobacteria bacterium]
MERQTERRRWARERLSTPEVAILYPEYGAERQDATGSGMDDTLMVYVLDRSEGGLLLQSSSVFEAGSSFDMRLRSPADKTWVACEGKVVWGDRTRDSRSCYLLGVELHQAAVPERTPASGAPVLGKRMHPSELEFLIRTQLFDFIADEAKCPLLNCMTPKRVLAGERFISQGDEGDSLYIIQDGSCMVKVEREGVIHPVARLQAGDIVGEMALLTGERRTAHVDAETEMTLWSLTREQFDSFCLEHPDLGDFLTELVTHRFSTAILTAYRNVGKYIINEILGRGGWSIVYKGVHASLNMPVAIKMLKHTMALHPEFSEKFKNEAKTIANLNHENIVKVYDIEELYRTIFIVMEYLEGVSLESILRRTPRLPVPKVVDILLQVCAGLSYAHEHGIVHQDIKPANVFVQTDDRAKIVDFGLSSPPGTADFSLPGTVYYMSPEQIDGESIDERTDIYSLGIVAYEMVTGRRPYPEDDLAKLMDMHVREDVPDPSTLVPDLPDELHYFIKRATHRDPAARFKTVWEILRDLQPFADKIGLKRQPYLTEQQRMMSLFLFYQDEHQVILNRLVGELSSELRKIGAILRTADLKDV